MRANGGEGVREGGKGGKVEGGGWGKGSDEK